MSSKGCFTTLEGFSNEKRLGIPRLINGPKTVAQQVFSVESIRIFHLLREVAFRGIIAENVLYYAPYAFTVLNNAILYLTKSFNLIFRIFSAR